MAAVMPYYEVHGDERLPPLMMVHGFLSSRAQWRANLARLGTVCRPVLVELWGHGRSPAPGEDDHYRIEAYVEAFEAIRRRLGAERWAVCGQSFGAGLAIAYALAHPDRIRGLIVTNSLSAFSPPGDLARKSLQKERIEQVRAGGRAAIEAQRIHPRHAKRLPEAIKAELVEDAGRISVEGVLRSWLVTSPHLSMTERLAALEVPALLVNGTWEKRFQPMRDAAAAAHPGLAIVDLPGGHSINIEAAEGFDRAVAQFVGRLPA